MINALLKNKLKEAKTETKIRNSKVAIEVVQYFINNSKNLDKAKKYAQETYGLCEETTIKLCGKYGN